MKRKCLVAARTKSAPTLTTAPSLSILLPAVAALVGCGDLSASIRLRNPQTAAEWAAVYAAEMREMRRMLQVDVAGWSTGSLASGSGLVHDDWLPAGP